MDSRTRSAVIMATLIVAGETVFLLPFVVARIFRPTFLDVFGITNLQLGAAFALTVQLPWPLIFWVDHWLIASLHAG